ncbi:MAG: hypothetical protein IJ943_03970 [Akkermansia sp.]|nr:hypothetical protein [Akkermansia sp.]
MRMRILPEVSAREKATAALLMYGGAVCAGFGYLMLVIATGGERGYHVAALLGTVAAVGGNGLLALGQYAKRVNDYRMAPQSPLPSRWKHWLALQGVAVLAMGFFILLLQVLHFLLSRGN